MARKTYVYIDGVAYDKEELRRNTADGDSRTRGFPSVAPDLPDFVSPIDGRRYSGRAGLRDHCARHDVVPTADLAGLPTVRPVPQPNREEVREAIKKVMYQKGYLR